MSKWVVTSSNVNIPRGGYISGQMPPYPLYPQALPLTGPTLQPMGPAVRGVVAGGYVQPTLGANPGLVVPYSPERNYALRAEERAEPVVGWRRYQLDGGSGELTLYGQRVEWPEASLVATCVMDIDTQILTQLTDLFGDKGAEVYKAYAAARGVEENSGERLAAEHIRDGFCQCGIYGGYYPGNTMGQGAVIAKCQAWGYVAVDEASNWKATHVRIEAMWLLRTQLAFSHWIDWPRVTANLRQRYGCPVFVVDDTGDVPW